MFIQNKNGEVVNVDHIIAVKICNNSPYQINVFTEKTETVFDFEFQLDVNRAMGKLESYLAQAGLRWVQCQNWRFRSDKILAINDEPCRNLTVSMVGKDFHVYTGAQSDEDLVKVKKQIATSLSENFFDSDRPVFMRLA